MSVSSISINCLEFKCQFIQTMDELFVLWVLFKTAKVSVWLPRAGSHSANSSSYGAGNTVDRKKRVTHHPKSHEQWPNFKVSSTMRILQGPPTM